MAKKGEDHVVLGEKRREREDHTALAEWEPNGSDTADGAGA